MVMEQQGCTFGEEPRLDVFGVALDSRSRAGILSVVDLLRKNGISADMDFNDRSVKAQMKAASARNARLACILGEDELARGTVAVKNLATGEQKETAGEGLAQAVKEMLSTLKG